MSTLRTMLFLVACALAVPVVGLAACGDGLTDGDEACDLGSGNGAPTTCCTPDCRFRAADETCRPPAGDCDAPEACSGVGADCPADSKVAPGVVCRTAVGACDVTERCDGDSAECPADLPAPDGAPCDDADACTPTDACEAGACVGTSGLACDPCEVCDATHGCVLPTAPECWAAPSGDSTITIKRVVGDPTRNVFTWKWLATDPIPLADFGDPMTSSDYTMCVIDQTGGAPSLRMSATAPAGGTCLGQPCWKVRGSGTFYKDKDATPDGVLRLAFRAGTPTKLKAKGKGANLAMPFPELVPPVVVRMVRSDGAPCWEAGYSRPIADLPTLFKARSD